MSEAEETVAKEEPMGYTVVEEASEETTGQQQEMTPKEESMEMGVAEQASGGGAEQGMQVSEPAEVTQPMTEEGGDTESAAQDQEGEGDADMTSGAAAEGAAQQNSQDERKLFVGGLSWETDEKKLKEYFQQFGEVEEVTIKYNKDTHQSRGFGFVVFAVNESVDKALDVEKHTVDKRVIDVKKAIPHSQYEASKNRTKKIFVGGVPTDMSEDTIREYFKAYGEIEEVALVTDKGSDNRRGFVFVTYTSEAPVDKVTEKSFHKIDSATVEVKRATPRDAPTAGGHMPRGGSGWRGGRMGRGMAPGGGYGRAGWVPYGQYGQHQYTYYDGSWDPGYNAYPGTYGGYGGPPPSRGGAGYSRYGPVKNYGQHGTSYHPYSR